MIYLNQAARISLILSISVFILSMFGSLGSYYSQIGSNGIKGPFFTSMIVCFLAYLINIKYARFIPLLIAITWVVYFDLLTPLIYSIVIIITVIETGKKITNFFHPENNSTFLNLCTGHIIWGFILWLVIRFAKYDAKYIFIFLSLIFIAITMLYLVKNIRKLFKYFTSINNSTIVNNYILKSSCAVGLSYLLYSSLYSFYFDDINGYLYAPLRVYFDGGFIFGPDRPGFMTNMSAFSLGYGGLISSLLGYSRENFIFTFKLFHAISYLVSIISFSVALKEIISEKIQSILIILLGLLPLIIFELSGNYADFYVLLVSMYITYSLIQLFENKFNFNTNYFFFNSFIVGLFLIVSLKTIPYLLSYFLILIIINFSGISNLRASFNINKFITILICTFLICGPILVLLLDNYFKTGNPTFPGGNGLWKSPYFQYDGIVAGRFHFPNMPDGSTFIQLFSFTPQASQLFSSGNSYFPIYGVFSQSILYAIPFFLLSLVLVGIDKSSQVISTCSISLLLFLKIISTFIIISLLVGPQHRYFFGLNVYLFVAFLLIVNSFNFIRLSFINNKFLFEGFYLIFILIALFTFYGNHMNPPPFTVTDDRMLISKVDKAKWYKKKVFYARVNEYIKDDKKIILSYLQDKFFINSKYVYELDWYDYPLLNDVNKIFNSTNSPNIEKKLHEIRNYLCLNNYGYFILSKDAVIYDKLFKDHYLHFSGIGDDIQELYFLKCD